MRHLCVVAMVVVAMSAVADAKSVKLEPEGVVAWIPDKWTIQADAGAKIATAPNGMASAIFLSQAIRDLDLAYRGLPNVLQSIAPGMELGNPKRKTVGGLAAIAIDGTVEVESQRIEAQILIAITPTKRALYLITLVAAEKASSFDDVIDKILDGVKVGVAEEAAPSKENPCWEMKGHPNGWSRKTWNGLAFLLPPGWTHAATRDPDTEEESLTISHGGAAIVVFGHAAASAAAAWQAIGEHAGQLGLGDAARGNVVGQPALCARGSSSDGVVFHRGKQALIMLGRVDGDPSAMRGILGSMRWK